MKSKKQLPDNTLVGGFVRTRHNDRKAPLQVEPIRPDELARTNPDEAAHRLAEGPSGRGRGQWPRTRKRRTKLAVLGIPAGVLDAGDPAYARIVRLASAYRKLRCRELVVVHGYVSSGASALLATAAMALGASRLLYEKAAGGGDTLIATLKAASALADSARQNELAAWELCAREAAGRKKAALNEQGIPWLIQKDDDSGYAPKKPGPKSTKSGKDQEHHTLKLPPVGTNLESWVQEVQLPDAGTSGKDKDS